MRMPEDLRRNFQIPLVELRKISEPYPEQRVIFEDIEGGGPDD